MVRGALVPVCNPSGQALRMLGWMYLVPLVAFLVVWGRDYYLAPAYPLLPQRERFGARSGSIPSALALPPGHDKQPGKPWSGPACPWLR
jgi:hypothetical protein